MADQLTSKQVSMAALEAGFSLATMCGQDDKQLMPMADYATLEAFAKKVRALSSSETTKCETCNGHGLVGGLKRWGDGEVDSIAEPCPDCNPSEPSRGEMTDARNALELIHWPVIAKLLENYRIHISGRHDEISKECRRDIEAVHVAVTKFLQSSPNAASTGMERDILAKLLDMRDTHLRVYEYEKQHYVIDHELWESARNALNSPQDSDRRNLGCDYCKNPLYAGLKCPGCGQEASKPQDERSLHEKMNMPPVSVQNLTIRTKE